MNKKQLRQRIKDIATGAQLHWLEEDQYWDNMCPEVLSNFMEGLVTALGINRDSYLVHFANLDESGDLDKLTQWLWNNQDELNV